MLATLLEEADWPRYLRAMADAATPSISAANWVELCIVLRGRYPGVEARLSGLSARLNIRIVPLDTEQANVACDAFRRYGKGRHPASLNFGDCFAYALARHLNQPLLFKGDDFVHTDVLPALTG